MPEPRNPITRGLAAAAASIERRSRPLNPLSRAISWVLAICWLGQGLDIILGGAGRWVGPGYTLVREFPGAPASWGVAAAASFAVAIIGLIARQFWVKAAGMFGCAAWCGAFAITSEITVRTIPSAGTTAFWAYLALAAVFSLMLFTREERTSP